MSTEYESLVNRIMSLRRFGKKKGIDVSSEMLDELGRPEKDMKVIRVAGTNGKGSSCNYIANILMKLGFKVGLFTSPHLVDFSERIQVGVDDTFTRISHEDVLRLGHEILDMECGFEATMFDVCFVMAILYYKEMACDYVILETGLGGTYDSTSAISCIPKVCVITSIGLDHTKYLGSSIEEIASNKAGIIVSGSRVVLSHMSDAARDVILQDCEDKGIPQGDVVVVDEYDYSPYKILNRLGGFWIYNAKAVIAAVRTLVDVDRDSFIIKYMEYNQRGAEHCGRDCEKCADIDKSCELSFDEWVNSFINVGIISMKFPGRMEKLSDNVILDGAHNIEAFRMLSKTLSQEYEGRSIHIIMAVLEDKDYEEEIEIIAPVASEFLTATIDDSRAKSGEELAGMISNMGYKATYLGTEGDAAAFINKLIKKNDAKSSLELYNNLYVVCGSLYFVGNIKRLLE